MSENAPPFFHAAETARLAAADQKCLWHPFTQMQAWCDPADPPLILERGEGVWLWDRDGNRYFDGNSSIWTNIHGHGHPRLTAALANQLRKVAHTSFLGFSNEPAIRLAEALLEKVKGSALSRVFYTDDGSTAIECALKMAVQFFQLTGQPERCEFVAFDRGYHGDTLGATSLGGIASMHGRFHRLGLWTHHLADAAALEALPDDEAGKVAAVVIEPLIQGAAGMRLWPAGMLGQLRAWCDRHGALLIFDEVMTGFGRTGTLFACQQEEIWPDILCLAKGLTGGYLPLAATLSTERVFDAFLGQFGEQRTFYHGHSYCGNPLACAVALASLKLFDEEPVLEALPETMALLGELLDGLKAKSPRHVGGIRQCGMIAGIDLMADAEKGVPFDWRAQTGAKVCRAARSFGLLTRPILDTLVLMPPLCVTAEELRFAVRALSDAVSTVLRD